MNCGLVKPGMGMLCVMCDVCVVHGAWTMDGWMWRVDCDERPKTGYLAPELKCRS